MVKFFFWLTSAREPSLKALVPGEDRHPKRALFRESGDQGALRSSTVMPIFLTPIEKWNPDRRLAAWREP